MKPSTRVFDMRHWRYDYEDSPEGVAQARIVELRAKGIDAQLIRNVSYSVVVPLSAKATRC